MLKKTFTISTIKNKNNISNEKKKSKYIFPS